MHRFLSQPGRLAGATLTIASAALLAGCGGGSDSGSNAGSTAGTGTTAASSDTGQASSIAKVDGAFAAAPGVPALLLAKKRTRPPTTTLVSCSYTPWVDGTSYVAGNIVKYPANSQFYKASHDNPGYDPTISTWYWDPYPCDPATSTDASQPTPAPGAFVVSEAQFNQMFPTRNAFYTYSGLVAAAAAFPAVFNTGTDIVKKQEAAAFLANVAHETGGLVYIRESNQANWPYYCESSVQYPCAAGQQYYGRGPIQISWNYNYGAAGDALGLNLLADPDLVARDAAVSWKTALWYWATQSGGASMTPHNAMVNAAGFGETIRAINGGLECRQPVGSIGYQQMQSRVTNYKNFTQMLGVDPGANLTC